ncbi:hypothetical protein IAU60_005491 [Kwoniella sp. DSM 27419]
MSPTSPRPTPSHLASASSSGASSARHSFSNDADRNSVAFSPAHSRQGSRSKRLAELSPSTMISQAHVADDGPFPGRLGEKVYPEASPSLAKAELGLGLGSAEGYGYSTPGHGPIARLPHIGLRRRRLLSQVLALLALVTLLGWWNWPYLGEGEGEAWKDSSISPAGIAALDQPPPLGLTAAATSDKAHVPGSRPLSHAEKLADQAKIKPQPWGLELSSSSLLAGLRPWPANPPLEKGAKPLSDLGHFADSRYSIGPLTRAEYTDQMREFALGVFPKPIADRLVAGLEASMGNTPREPGKAAWDQNKMVWQTAKAAGSKDLDEVRSWKDGKATEQGWDWRLLTDDDANAWVRRTLAGSRLQTIWDHLPSGILRSDTLRYLLVLLEGGIYTDTDTRLQRAPSEWGKSAKLFRDGADWLTDLDRWRMDNGEEPEEVLGPPSVVVGIEADVGERQDWFDWWPRPMQIVQWTLAAAPSHPISLNAIMRIYHATAQAVDWAHANAKSVQILKDQGRYDDARALAEVTVMNEPAKGGPVGVMDWTGPGVWTDAVLSYLRVQYGVLWTDLRGIREPLRIGDVVILPVTGFSPGVGNFGSQPRTDPQAMVEHLFAGSWKEE